MMASRNQNRPPRSPATKRDGGEGVSVDKRRRVGAGAGRTGGPERKPFSSVNKKLEGASSTAGSNSESLEGGVIEFTKEEVEALVNERPKMKKFDHKGNLEVMTEFNGRLKVCIKWCQKREEGHVEEESKLRSSLEASEKRCVDMEAEMRCKEETYRASLAELSKENASLQEKLSKEESDKLGALESHRKEHEARIALETVQASLSKDLEKAHQDILVANQRAASLDADYKRSQEYNQNLQQHISKVLADLNAERESLKRVEKDKSTIVESLSALRGHYHSLQEQLTMSKTSRDEAVSQKNSLESELKCVRGDLQQVRDDRDRQLAQVQALTADLLKYQENSGKLFAEIDVVTEKTKSLEETCSSQRQQISLLEQKLSAANEKLKILDMTAGEARTGYEEQRKIVSDLQERLSDAEHKLLEGEKLRKKLHNTILELKGNIRVFCRVRPVLPDDGCRADTQVISYPGAFESLGRGIDVVQNAGQKYPFTFDKVFSHDASQQDVFVEISQLVQSALDGYKVCIFAYGQTGSGKTYTMMGRPEASDLKGLIPRSLEQVFEASQSLMAQGWKYKMQASMLEIYNETIRDLLSPSSSSSCADSNAPAKQYKIQHDANGNTNVTDLTVVDVSSISEVSSLLRKAAQSRSVGKTNMNEQSSRSHFVFTLRIYGVNEGTDQQLQGVLNLIDLAGSERLSRSGATGDRLKETQAINKSLSCLANVIFALAKKEDHVPFRDSKLTHLLQPCLGGESKTLMFVNVSPDPSSVGESLCSLKFAARVNACEIGVARRQMNLKPPAAIAAADSRLSYG
ncbi:Kinesin-like protein KIN-14C [Linum perenne]